ncbi:Lactam utilization protein lamB [Vanrija pseudolonga]|uniref:Lactam utilization protein lamB n=1 Tax=Vanrija pseudolonga TaxID=143232 RepID=A0AAF0YDP8_9TREE|nr:Lactam utilization protein lamB [Vanrija pseudolonga]
MTTDDFPRHSLNCDMGEGYYRWALGPDEELFPLIDFCNVACGFHAGDHNTMLKTVRSAIKHGVRIGAHPGLDDVRGFGRRKLEVTDDEVYAMALYQLGALKAIVEAEGAKVSHVKPHGMLYFIIRDDAAKMRAFMKAQTSIFGTTIPFFGLKGTPHEAVAAEFGVRFIPELFCDIDYDPSGKLLGVPQSHAPTAELIGRKLDRLFSKAETIDIDGNPLPLDAAKGPFTICLHSDMPTAVANVSAAREVVDRYKTAAA